MGTAGAISRNHSFNSSVGILSVGTFQAMDEYGEFYVVSIPQSEFCPLGLVGDSPFLNRQRKFQFLSRNSVRWDEHSGSHGLQG